MEWYRYNHKEGWELDKDVLVKGNKLYSPETCTMLPKEVNTTLTKNDAKRSSEGIGVVLRPEVIHGKSYRSTSLDGLSYYSKEEAFYAYKICKEGRLKRLAEKYKEDLTEAAYKALCCYEVLKDD